MKSNKFAVFIDKVDQWDKRIIGKCNGIGGKYITFFLKQVSFFGRETLWLFLIAFYLFLWYNPLSLSYIGATFLCGVILILSIKNAVKRERPFETLEDIKVLENHPTSRSFPSWHTYNVASQGIVLGVVFNSYLILLVFAVLAVFVAFSRVQLGVHYPSDVVIGCILGILGGFLTLLIIGPFTHFIITCLEQFALHEIEYNSLNSRLGEAWYLIICIAIFGVIFFSAEYKTLKKIIKKYRN